MRRGWRFLKTTCSPKSTTSGKTNTPLPAPYTRAALPACFPACSRLSSTSDLERDAFLYVTDFMEEQEDSADFRKSPQRQRRPAARRSGAARGQAGREPRESRPSRTGISIESEPRAVSGTEARSGSPSSVSEAGGRRRPAGNAPLAWPPWTAPRRASARAARCGSGLVATPPDQ